VTPLLTVLGEYNLTNHKYCIGTGDLAPLQVGRSDIQVQGVLAHIKARGVSQPEAHRVVATKP